MYTSRRGFTLIELLVVIAIIGLLASVVIASLSTARVKARDARRVTDMNTIRTALEMYASDNGHYPDTHGNWTSFDAPAYVNNDVYSPNAIDLSTALAPYLSTPPKDPARGSASNAGYRYTSPTGGNDYCILIYGTPENMDDFKSYMVPASCGSVVNGTCSSGTNAVYFGTSGYSGGC